MESIGAKLIGFRLLYCESQNPLKFYSFLEMKNAPSQIIFIIKDNSPVLISERDPLIEIQIFIYLLLYVAYISFSGKKRYAISKIIKVLFYMKNANLFFSNRWSFFL